MMPSSHKRLPKPKDAVLPRRARLSMLEDPSDGENPVQGARRSVLSSSTNVRKIETLHQASSSRKPEQQRTEAGTLLKQNTGKPISTKKGEASRSASNRKSPSSPPKTLLVSQRRDRHRNDGFSSRRASSLVGQAGSDDDDTEEEEDAETTREENVSLLRSLSGFESTSDDDADGDDSSGSRSISGSSSSSASTSCTKDRSSGDEHSASEHESEENSDSDGGLGPSRYGLGPKFDAARSASGRRKSTSAASSVRKRMEMLKLEAVFDVEPADADSSDEKDGGSETPDESSNDSSDEYTCSSESDGASADSEVSFEEDEMAINLASKTTSAKKKATKSKPPPATEKRKGLGTSAAVASTPRPAFPRATSKSATSKTADAIKATTCAVQPKNGKGSAAASSSEGRGNARRRQPLQPKAVTVRSARRSTSGRATITRRKAVSSGMDSRSSTSGDSNSNALSGSVRHPSYDASFPHCIQLDFERAPTVDGKTSIPASQSMSEVLVEKAEGSDTDTCDEDSVVEAEIVVHDDPLNKSLSFHGTQDTVDSTKAGAEDMSLDETPVDVEETEATAENPDNFPSPIRNNQMDSDSLDRSASTRSSLCEAVADDEYHAVSKAVTSETCEAFHCTSTTQKAGRRSTEEPSFRAESECTSIRVDDKQNESAIDQDTSCEAVSQNDHVGSSESEIASRVALKIPLSPELRMGQESEVVQPVAQTAATPASPLSIRPSDTGKVSDHGFLVENLPPQSEAKSVRWTPDVKNEPIRNEKKRRQRFCVKRGQWLIGQKIGSGAFGVVHIGLNKANGTFMAVKQITLQTAVIVDIRREVELLKSLHHENIVQYYGAELDDSSLYIFQEWVAGGTITRMLTKFGAFPTPVVRSYTSQALRGLTYLHEKGVMHRDIKGSNILVSHDGVCKLCDFGGSKRLESEKMQKHTMRGTPYFCAPEVFEERYSFKADVWSLGCVVFQMASGSPPWKDLGISNPVALYNHVKNQTGPPPMVFPAIDPDEDSLADLKSLIARCFRQSPDERPSARELLNDPFLQETQYHSDDEKSAVSRSALSAGTGTPDLWKQLDTTDEFTKPSPSCGTSLHRRGSSSGPPATIDLFSPPLPKRRSPQVDTNDWPTWAREYTATTGTKSPKTDNPFDSLQYSNSTAIHSPLRGLPFVNT